MQLLLECKVRPEVLCNRSNSAKLRASAVAAARCGSSSRKSGACHTERWQHYSDESFQLVDDVGGTTLLRSCQSIRPAGVDLLKLVLLDLQPPASYIHRFSAGTVALQRHGRRTGARLHERMQDPITSLHDKAHAAVCLGCNTKKQCMQAGTHIQVNIHVYSSDQCLYPSSLHTHDSNTSRGTPAWCSSNSRFLLTFRSGFLPELSGGLATTSSTALHPQAPCLLLLVLPLLLTLLPLQVDQPCCCCW